MCRCHPGSAKSGCGDYALKTGSLKALLAITRNPAWLCFGWCGVAAGVTLIAIPAIFGAPGAARADAIGMASAVFVMRDHAEIGMLIVLLILVRLTTSKRKLLAPALGITLVVVMQSTWLLPQLVDRAAQIAGGMTPEPSNSHAIFSMLEIVKILLLLYLAIASMRVFRRA